MKRNEEKIVQRVGDIYHPKWEDSGAIIPNWMMPLKGISSVAKLCWTKMKDYDNLEKGCFPKQEDIARDCGIVESTVKKAIEELVRYKLIKVEKPEGINKLKHFHNNYVFLIHKYKINPVQKPPRKAGGNPPVKPGVTSPSIQRNSNQLNISEELLRSSSNTDSLRSSVGKIKRVKRISIKDLSDGIEDEQKTYLIHKNRKKIKKVVMSDNVREIIERWNSSSGLRKLKYGTSLHKNTVVTLNKLMKGTYFTEEVFAKDEDINKFIGKKFSPEKIMKAIDNFSLSIDDAHYSPKESTRRWYKKHSLNDFIFDSRQRTSKHGISLFLQFYAKKLRPSTIPSVPLPDNYPTQTLALKNRYVKEVLGGVNGNMSEKDINSFKIGSEKLNNFYKANSRKIFNVVGGINDMPKLLFKAIAKECENRNYPIRPYKFSSDYAFEHTLPSYLRDQGVIYSDAEINDGDIKVQTGDDY